MPFSDVLSQLNWVDVFIVTILFRTSYIGFKQGFVIEVFKILGAIFICYFTLHYYAAVGGFLADKTPVADLMCKLFSYLAISALIFIIFTLIRQNCLFLLKIETIDKLRTWGGLVLGCARGFFLSSLICLFLFITGANYLTVSIRQSYSGKKIINIAPTTYKSIFNSLVVKFTPNAELNYSLFNTLERK